ncbi:DNA invertase Pin-like site-specific DNA recombinase [Anaerobacterium chartisolvens]|uniref:DNA invertase Pin-like site-specific DNA recombinase n=1 Tax=Anaerobacterium chartisolvens TaxID=1297424 RepID=A0A369B4A8_9FIRM|nr:recombinase family protein [Anaerobacterium chartisolvens]RCX15428.1 DNA invertase Pin-like site-specific DNA recombinase [Anaerobacterium chartisolvens]
MDNTCNGINRIGVYVRESRDDNEENFETIETQRDLLMDYVKKNGMGMLVKVYIDDNVSGSGFERRGIEQLKQDVAERNIDMVIIKDLSRLGRNNAKTLLFLDYLEENGVRVVTFDGKYDSLRDNETVGIETWYNERYIRDISRKIRSSLKFKIQKGEYIGHAPYGYTKSGEEKNRLCVDREAAGAVRDIFAMYSQGYGYAYIAKQLSGKGIPTPASGGGRRCGTGKWSAVAVKRIICNPVYKGVTVQGTTERLSFKSKKTRRLPPEKWVVTPGTHEAIIDAEKFDEVQSVRSLKNACRGSHKGTIHLLRGMIYCGKCGSPMLARKRKDRGMGYICSRYAKEGKSSCTSHYINEGKISRMLCEELINMLTCATAKDSACKMLEELLGGGMEEIGSELYRMEEALSTKGRQQDLLYMDKLEGKISEQLFLRINSNIENRIAYLQSEINTLRNKSQRTFDCFEAMNKIIRSVRENGINNEIVKAMVERIDVYDIEDKLPRGSGPELEQFPPCLHKRVVVIELKAEAGF